MAFRFKLDERFDKGFRRIAREQLDKTFSELVDLTSRPTSVHESRKALKRLRALLRLVAPAIGDKAFTRRNKALRRVGHLLAVSRDAAVIEDTLHDLVPVGDPRRAAIADAGREISAYQSHGVAQPSTKIGDKARALLLKEERHFAALKFKGTGLAAIEQGLEDSYRAARRALRLAYKHPSDETVHDLRKTVQWHWRHMALLSRAWPEVFAARIAAARDLSQMLGRDHDFAMVREAAAKTPSIDAETRSMIVAICDEQQSALRREAEPRLHQLFAESAPVFVRRIAAYWEAGVQIAAQRQPKADSNVASKADSTALQPTSSAGDTSSDTADTGSTLATRPIAAKTPGQSQSQRRA